MKRLVATSAVLVWVASGCGSAPDDTVTILAASSLADVMPQVIAVAERERPDEAFEVSYAASSQIVQQLNAGIDADAAVLAGQGPLASLDPSVAAGTPAVVATNTLAIALADGNPGRVTSLADLGNTDITLVLCAEQVPCGAAAAQMFHQTGINPTIASLEPDVRATLSKVVSGEADAGVVYVTDLVGQSVGHLDVRAEDQVVTTYPALSIDDSRSGADFVDLLSSDTAQKVLRDAGFGAP